LNLTLQEEGKFSSSEELPPRVYRGPVYPLLCHNRREAWAGILPGKITDKSVIGRPAGKIILSLAVSPSLIKSLARGETTRSPETVAVDLAFVEGASVDQPSSAATELLAVLSKSPMPAASKALALEYAANNIRFNTVSPAVVNTPMHAKRNHAELAKLHPLGRMGEISDVVDAVLYLQSATFVTGENIRVDGGVHAGR
jgi:NAD(P)-dependent dehydrogenase (short-subunit alcohol dehydrogenase family)